MAIQKAEKVTLLLAGPLMMFYKVMYPFIWVLNGSARVVTGLFGLKPASEHEVAHTEEEYALSFQIAMKVAKLIRLNTSM